VATVADADESLRGEVLDPVRGKRGVLTALVWIALAALSVVVVFGCLAVRSDRVRESQRQGFVDGAVAGTLALIDVHSATLDEYLAELKSLTTGTFADELKSGESAFVASIRDFAVDSDGHVDTAALASESGTSGVVLIAASAQVGNSAGESSARTYRLRVGVEEVDGRVLMSSVEFVP
jgi:Mce-associated membrane protein